MRKAVTNHAAERTSVARETAITALAIISRSAKRCASSSESRCFSLSRSNLMASISIFMGLASHGRLLRLGSLSLRRGQDRLGLSRLGFLGLGGCPLSLG